MEWFLRFLRLHEIKRVYVSQPLWPRRLKTLFNPLTIKKTFSALLSALESSFSSSYLLCVYGISFKTQAFTTFWWLTFFISTKHRIRAAYTCSRFSASIWLPQFFALCIQSIDIKNEESRKKRNFKVWISFRIKFQKLP